MTADDFRNFSLCKKLKCNHYFFDLLFLKNYYKVLSQWKFINIINIIRGLKTQI